MTPQYVRFAMKCSVAVLLAEELNDHLDLMPELPRPVIPTLSLLKSAPLYLWTFTTPDVVGMDQLARRWDNFGKRILRGRKKLVKWMRVFEPHVSHGYHVHAVAVRRYDVTTIRTHAERSGFGRLNVTVIPGEKVGYVAKYLNKHKRRPGEKCRRLWACQGFKGISASKVRIADSWHQWVWGNAVGPGSAKDYPWHYLLERAIELKCGHLPGLTGCRVKDMNKAQEAKALALLSKGAKVCIVEFRTSEVREAKKYIDGRASLSEKTYWHQLFCESNNKPMLIEEQLPDSYKPGDVVKVPMTKGQSAVLEIEKVRVFNNVTTYSGRFHEVA